MLSTENGLETGRNGSCAFRLLKFDCEATKPQVLEFHRYAFKYLPMLSERMSGEQVNKREKRVVDAVIDVGMQDRVEAH
jgi:hypothetical protein